MEAVHTPCSLVSGRCAAGGRGSRFGSGGRAPLRFGGLVGALAGPFFSMWLGCASRTPPSADLPPELEELARQPVFLPYEVPPTHGPGDLDAALKRHFPPVAKACNAPPFLVWAFVDAEGRVLNAQVSRTSGDEEVDRAGLAAIREVLWTPALNRGKAVPVWIAVTLDFAQLCEVIRG